MDSEISTDIRANLERVQAVIAAACRRAGRSPDGVLLIAVSKTMPAERVKAAVEAGAAALGENRVQEAKDKLEALGHPVPWHLIGHLQTNKAKDAVQLFDCIQSVDRLDLAKEIESRSTRILSTSSSDMRLTPEIITGMQAIVWCDSAPACALYESLGFRRCMTIVAYAR